MYEGRAKPMSSSAIICADETPQVVEIPVRKSKTESSTILEECRNMKTNFKGFRDFEVVVSRFHSPPLSLNSCHCSIRFSIRTELPDDKENSWLLPSGAADQGLNIIAIQFL